MRAERTASPVPSGYLLDRDLHPARGELILAAGDATTTSGEAPASRPLTITQSTMRRPRIGWKCLATALFMRVPRPPAITIAASGVSVTSGASV